MGQTSIVMQQFNPVFIALLRSQTILGFSDGDADLTELPVTSVAPDSQFDCHLRISIDPFFKE
jgi:hypothetical protein